MASSMDVKPLLRLLRDARGGDPAARTELRRVWAHAETMDLGARVTLDQLGRRLKRLSNRPPGGAAPGDGNRGP